MYNGVIFNEIDELDHFTKAVRGGRPLDRKSAAALIKKYAAEYDCVGALDSRFTANGEDLGSMTEAKLYDGFVEVRNAMTGLVGIKGFRTQHI